jgi:hypothetical protein
MILRYGCKAKKRCIVSSQWLEISVFTSDVIPKWTYKGKTYGYLLVS